jgi:hypothetical protein
MADKGKRLILWQVKHPDHCRLPVVAENREQAILKAAQIWGVPFARVAFFTDADKEADIMPHVCPRCRRYNAINDEEYCRKCQVEIRSEEQRLRAARQAYYRREAKDRKGGTA